MHTFPLGQCVKQFQFINEFRGRMPLGVSTKGRTFVCTLAKKTTQFQYGIIIFFDGC